MASGDGNADNPINHDTQVLTDVPFTNETQTLTTAFDRARQPENLHQGEHTIDVLPGQSIAIAPTMNRAVANMREVVIISPQRELVTGGNRETVQGPNYELQAFYMRSQTDGTGITERELNSLKRSEGNPTPEMVGGRDPSYEDTRKPDPNQEFWKLPTLNQAMSRDAFHAVLQPDNSVRVTTRGSYATGITILSPGEVAPIWGPPKTPTKATPPPRGILNTLTLGRFGK